MELDLCLKDEHLLIEQFQKIELRSRYRYALGLKGNRSVLKGMVKSEAWLVVEPLQGGVRALVGGVRRIGR